MYCSDVDYSNEEKWSYLDLLSVCRHQVNLWSIYTVNDVLLLEDVEEMLEISIYVYYIEGALTYYAVHSEDESLSSVSSLGTAAQTIWYVNSFPNHSAVKDSLAGYIIHHEYFYDHRDSARQPIGIEIVCSTEQNNFPSPNIRRKICVTSEPFCNSSTKSISRRP